MTSLIVTNLRTGGLPRCRAVTPLAMFDVLVCGFFVKNALLSLDDDDAYSVTVRAGRRGGTQIRLVAGPLRDAVRDAALAAYRAARDAP